jgi:hypothetical protein
MWVNNSGLSFLYLVLLSFKNVCVFGINCQVGVVIVVASYLLDGRRNESFISIRKLSGRLWGPPSLLFSGNRGCSLGVSAMDVKLAPSLHLVPRLSSASTACTVTLFARN